MQNKQSYPTIKDFVLQEAYEKAFEKMVMGLKQYELEKTKIIAERMDTVNLENDKKTKDNLAKRRILKSSLINSSRMSKMNHRHEKLLDIVKDAEKFLADSICNNETKYRALLKSLIVEGLIKMLEPIVYVRCLQRDRKLVESLLVDCKREFQQLLRKEGIDESVAAVDLQIDAKFFLEELKVGGQRVKKSEENNKCFGGVILTSEDGRIVCKNTIDSRLELAYQHMLPTIRSELFSC